MEKEDRPSAYAVESALDTEKSSHEQSHFQVDEKLSLIQTFKDYPVALAWCFYMIFTCIMYGYDGMAAAIVLSIPKFREDYGYPWEGQYVVSAAWQTGFTAVGLFGIVLGGIATGLAQNHIGQKACIGSAYMLTTAGVFMQWYSPGSLPLFTAGKFLTGIPLGVFLTVAPMYCSEVAPPNLRGAMVAAVNWGQVVGQLLGYGVLRETSAIPSNMSYRILYAVQWGFAGVGLGLLWFCPESPMRLVSRQKLDEARKSIRKLYSDVDVETRLRGIQTTLAEDAAAQAKAGSFKDCFKAKHRTRTLTAVSVFFFQANSGIAWVLGYMGYFLQLAGLQGQLVFNISVGVAGFMVVGNILGMFLIESIGRRPTFFWGVTTCTGALLVIGILTQFISRSTSIIYTQSALMGLWGFAYQASLGAAGYTMVAEVPTSALRGPTQAMATMTNGLFSGSWALALPYMINPDEANMGGNVAFVFFAASVPSCIFVYFFYPETKDRSFSEIDELYRRGIKPRHFARTTLD